MPSLALLPLLEASLLCREQAFGEDYGQLTCSTSDWFLSLPSAPSSEASRVQVLHRHPRPQPGPESRLRVHPPGPRYPLLAQCYPSFQVSLANRRT